MPEPSAETGTNPDLANSGKPGVNNKMGDSKEPMPTDKTEDKATPPESTEQGCQAATIEPAKPLVQVSKLDKVNTVMDSQSANEAAKNAPAKPVAPTNEAKTITLANTKTSTQAAITKEVEPLIQSATVDKVKPSVQSKSIDEVEKKSPEAKPTETKKTTSTKPAEKPNPPGEKSKANETNELVENGNVTESKKPEEIMMPSESKKPAAISKVMGKSDDKTNTPEVDGKRKPDDQGSHSLGGESANQFTPALPEDFLKRAQANIDASKQYIETSGSNIGSWVNSQIPSSRSLESKPEDLLVAPIIPRPKKRPAAKSLLKLLGQSHITRPLKKVKSVEAKTEKQSPGRAKSPGRGRTTQSKAPAESVPSAAKAKMLSEGPPTESLEGGWPEGWVKRVYERASGATKGSTDKYWYSPINGIKLRSIVEGKILTVILSVDVRCFFPHELFYCLSSAVYESTGNDKWERN